jgi:DNA mismatch repair protein MutS
MVQTEHLTPLMQQYVVIRQQYADHLLLFQVGDFYELFFEDAKNASSFLGIALTKRGHINGDPIPLCGVPVHALQHYLIKLVRGGFKVAICQQLEEPVPGKVVERGVTQVLTPGTLTDTQLLDEKAASYLCSFFPMNNSWGLLFSELMTAQIFGTVVPAGEHKRLEAEITRFMPDEILLPHTLQGKEFVSYFKKLGYFTSLEHIDQESIEQKREFDGWIHKQFHEKTEHMLVQKYALKSALHSFYSYIRKNNKNAIDQFRTISWYDADDFLVLDAATQRNLELVRNKHDGTKKGTLFDVLDKAVTPMGSRMIQKWITRPLIKQEQIEKRQQIIELFVKQLSLVQQLEGCLKQLGDLERIVGRIALKRAQLNDYLALKYALHVVPQIMQLLQQYDDQFLQTILSYVIDFASLHQLLEASLYEDGQKQWIIKQGFDQELDQLRELIENSNEKLCALELEEQQRTNIGSLKIRFNNVHGYYIEVTKPNMHLVPDYYVHQQTLVNRARFTTAKLQQLQIQINEAQEKISSVEGAIFERVKREVELQVTPLRKLSHALAHLDALFGLASIARDYDWKKPTFNEHRTILINGGRHPVIELTSTAPFISNDTLLDDAQSLWIITGPNMGGKSTYLRQVALNCILAQIGSFVPADKADLAILDRIFTRIGSGDHLLEGKSTFLVEMEETATICTQATPRSLVILDEVGRGTSTFDGLAIAQSVIEYIYKKIGARCLFATHYHELTKLEGQFPGIISYHAASKKTAHGITFLYKIDKGVADGSFGVQVAKLAQLPQEIIDRAQELLKVLSVHEQQLMQQIGGSVRSALDKESVEQAELQQAFNELYQKHKDQEALIAAIKDIDFDDLSPKKAFDLLWGLKHQSL